MVVVMMLVSLLSLFVVMVVVVMVMMLLALLLDQSLRLLLWILSLNGSLWVDNSLDNSLEARVESSSARVIVGMGSKMHWWVGIGFLLLDFLCFMSLLLLDH